MASNEATIPTGTHSPEGTRRDFLYIATGTVATVGAAAVLVPLIAQMNPDASTLAAGGPVDLDVSKIAPGQQVVIRWRERPIFVFHRSKQTLQEMQQIWHLLQVGWDIWVITTQVYVVELNFDDVLDSRSQFAALRGRRCCRAVVAGIGLLRYREAPCSQTRHERERHKRKDNSSEL